MENHAELKQLATRLRRPPLSLSALSSLTPEQLTWLEKRVSASCQRDREQIRTELRLALPWLLRWLMRRHFRQPS
jgi:hypothetical protein